MSISIHLSAFAAKGRAIFSASKSSEAKGLLACGIREIDDLLEGGFPKAGLTEIMVPASRRGEVRMLLGAVSHAASAVWVLPERGFEPFLSAFEAFGIDMSRELFVVPPTAEEAFDAAELALSSGEAEAVVAWLPALSPSRDRIRMRRLQLAAQTHGAALFAIRPAALACLAPEENLRLLFLPQDAQTIRIRAIRNNVFLNTAKEILLNPSKLAVGSQPANVPDRQALKDERSERNKTASRPFQPSLFPEALPAL